MPLPTPLTSPPQHHLPPFPSFPTTSSTPQPSPTALPHQDLTNQAPNLVVSPSQQPRNHHSHPDDFYYHSLVTHLETFCLASPLPPTFLAATSKPSPKHPPYVVHYRILMSPLSPPHVTTIAILSSILAIP
ncbi:hypothetical protein HYC85_003970 [Camellia sinensis]|uniref:Uncharacterized protein n=1 Tax=Camellia sinensis TaxID=4442 RepID=A0A7J7HW55_CAMSI|nr:hypothetical protein HYC85_003970 [Camellia sinensis]